jgi:hypothetical protein
MTPGPTRTRQPCTRCAPSTTGPATASCTLSFPASTHTRSTHTTHVSCAAHSRLPPPPPPHPPTLLLQDILVNYVAVIMIALEMVGVPLKPEVGCRASAAAGCPLSLPSAS